MQHNKVSHLFLSSLSFGDWSSADVYRNSQCSVWEVEVGDMCSQQKGLVTTARDEDFVCIPLDITLLQSLICFSISTFFLLYDVLMLK